MRGCVCLFFERCQCNLSNNHNFICILPEDQCRSMWPITSIPACGTHILQLPEFLGSQWAEHLNLVKMWYSVNVLHTSISECIFSSSDISVLRYLCALEILPQLPRHSPNTSRHSQHSGVFADEPQLLSHHPFPAAQLSGPKRKEHLAVGEFNSVSPGVLYF